jgi:uncharacterized phiE125 gp8 family phage protein
MSVVVISAPAAPAVSLAEAKAHLRVDHSNDDGLIESLIKAATQHLDGPQGSLGRALITQTLELRLDCFLFSGPITLPYPPLGSVTSVKYVDQNGTEQTVSTDVYRVIGGGAGLSRVDLKYDQSWPSPRSQREAVLIRYTAGYGTTSTDVPEAIRAAIKLHVGVLYENREAVAVGNTVAELPMAYEALLSTFRIHS